MSKPTFSKKPQSTASKMFSIFNYTVLALIGFIMFYPMFYVFIVSISSAEYINQGLVTFFPRGINFEAYKRVFQNDAIWIGYKNTFLYTGLGTLINVMMTAMCAYPLSRKEFYGRGPLTVLITVTMFINGGMIPLYLVVNGVHIINTMWAVILPSAISTYNMIVMRTSFSSIPDSLIESAHLDGANDIQILSKIILPLSKPILATMVLFYAVSHWNSYFPAMLYLNDQSKYPVQVIMRDIVIEGDLAQGGDMSGMMNVISTNYKYAVIIISIIPILMIYPFLQKYFTKGVMVGAVKG
ncbi:MAG: carbohydrate ABC transporter permease [Lachnospiraceae bacterium]|nr:carbohydrate ABC transporter permease [Lachnospiraceae bacterium]